MDKTEEQVRSELFMLIGRLRQVIDMQQGLMQKNAELEYQIEQKKKELKQYDRTNQENQ